MARYGQTFKDKAVARLLPPESAAIDLVARETVNGRTGGSYNYDALDNLYYSSVALDQGGNRTSLATIDPRHKPHHAAQRQWPDRGAGL